MAEEIEGYQLSAGEPGGYRIDFTAPTLLLYSRPPDDHEIYALIGRVAANWAEFEHTLDRIIWTLAKTPGSRGACLTAQMTGAWPRFNAINALLITLSESTPELESFIEKFNSLAVKTRTRSEERNRIIHDAWRVSNEGDTARFVSMSKNELKYGIDQHKREAINGTIAAIERHIATTQDWLTQISAILNA